MKEKNGQRFKFAVCTIILIESTGTYIDLNAYINVELIELRQYLNTDRTSPSSLWLVYVASKHIICILIRSIALKFHFV